MPCLCDDILDEKQKNKLWIAGLLYSKTDFTNRDQQLLNQD